MFAVLSLLLIATLVVTGLTAITTGRLLVPWLRRTVARPRMWGTGALLLAVGLAKHDGPFLILAGFVLVILAQLLRPSALR
ncbi:hypothetical protein AB0M39_33620 [Streptomyces sp. NPDC051907]|uniref:hypothetical protein n=1 Tax=Streptomyces sp. NPDC051907 TaxID=3155284 RepID=UPI0034150CFB